MADGKLVTKGLKENFCGDVNLFGHETNPNIAELREEIERHLNFVSQSLVNFNICDEVDKYGLLRDFTNCITGLTGKIRKFVSNEKTCLLSYTKSVFSEQKYVKVISLCKMNIYTCVSQLAYIALSRGYEVRLTDISIRIIAILSYTQIRRTEDTNLSN